MTAERTASVVVPVLNGAETIGDLLTALANQVGAPRDVEVLVVDNGSTDRTAAIVGGYPVALLHESRPGPSAARNRGLAQARGEVVVFADADTLPTRRWLAELLAPFADPATVVAGGHAVDYRPTTAAERFMAQLGVHRLEYEFFRARVPYVAAESMAVRRTALLAVGAWDETFRTAEDLDVCVRLVRRYGCRVLRQPAAVLFSRRRPTFEALFAQAWNYGQGLGQARLRYPEVIPLTPSRCLRLGHTLALRGATAAWCAGARRGGLATAERSAFARHHWDWSRAFWGGFGSMLRHRAWRER
ncbi:MAG: glycosyltransferase [Deltaproteobacteria bacterium]|nr:glycosyltransferase [Deltaproteobacteria bacterium]